MTYTTPQPIFHQLAQHLRARRKELLQEWRDAVLHDRKLTTGKALPRRQLDDHVPAALLAFEQHLKRIGEGADPRQPSDVAIGAADAHGAHRWQQGYDLHEVARELGHLNMVMVRELDAFAGQAGADARGMSEARQAWASAYAAGIEQSTSQYFRLRQVEASGHVRDLEAALAEISDLDRLRATLWEQMAHDLRGKVGAVALANHGLQMDNAPDGMRERFAGVLDRSVEALRHLLDDVTSLTRLQAGKEDRQIAAFDASELLAGLCDGLQGLAHQRQLRLRAVGPGGPMAVEGDAVKVRRLAQNLVINALKYTEVGGVDVEWAPDTAHGGDRWRLVVRDTGPGIQAGPAAPLAAALKHATDVAHGLDTAQCDAAAAAEAGRDGAPPDGTPARQSPGEGIGLSIVKRLAGLLDATIEVESEPGAGTAFTVIFPRSYPE
ncbi:MAG: sensor histidine kinase [Xylophilus ampelinus]